MANAAKAMTESDARFTAKPQAIKELIAVGEEGGNLFQKTV